MTQTGTTVGTVAYMSPEQARGQEVDHRTDIWSLGVVLYEMLAGQPPFQGEHLLSLSHAILTDDPPSLADRSAPLDGLVQRALSKRRNERYQSVSELSDHLRRLHAIGASRTRATDRTEVVSVSQAMRHLFDLVRAVAATDATVLIQGESGVGKELVARRIHEESERHDGPFIKVDCAAVTPEAFDRDFFGSVSTDAMEDPEPGHLEAANGGTLFLDQVAELPAALQTKLSGPLQDASYVRVGDSRTRRADVRYVAATTRDLTEHVSQGHFRQDLYFRLSVFPIDVPPLRTRPEDIPGLIAHFLAPTDADLSDKQVEHLQTYDWPGNVRELRNVVERARILSGTGPLRCDEALPVSKLSYTARGPLAEEQAPARGYYIAAELDQRERDNLVAVMEAANWRVSGVDGAAERLGLPASTCRSRLEALGVERAAADSLYMRLGSTTSTLTSSSPKASRRSRHGTGSQKASRFAARLRPGSKAKAIG